MLSVRLDIRIFSIFLSCILFSMLQHCVAFKIKFLCLTYLPQLLHSKSCYGQKGGHTCETKNLLSVILKSQQTLLKQNKVIISPVKIILTVAVQINTKYISLVIWLKLLHQSFLIYPFFFLVLWSSFFCTSGPKAAGVGLK